MKVETIWNYSDCNIGHPCEHCDDHCTFHLVKGADEKEKKDERTTKESKRTE